MKIPAVTFLNNGMSFGKIIYASGVDSNDGRVASMVKILQTPQDEFDGLSAEDFYKNKYDLDFLIDKCGEKTLKLDALHSARKIDTGINSRIKYNGDKSFEVGIYNDKHLFNVEDIEIKRVEKRKQNICNITIMSLILAGIIGFIVAESTRGHNKISELTKPLIENVDSTLNTKLNIPFA